MTSIEKMELYIAVKKMKNQDIISTDEAEDLVKRIDEEYDEQNIE